MLERQSVLALAAGLLLAPAPSYSASGQLVLSCKGQTTATSSDEPAKPISDAFLVFDFDRDLVFHNPADGGAPISAVKKYFITWASDDGSRAGYLNRVTLDAVEQSATAKTTYTCALYAQLSFKETSP